MNIDPAKKVRTTIQSIPHEVSHNVFERIPRLLLELRIKLDECFEDLGLTAKQRLIRTRILPWMNEIIADMGGTALGRFENADSAIQLMATGDENIDVNDDKHPIPILRPWIHFWLLDQLVLQDTTLDDETRKNLRARLDDLKARLDARETGLMDRRMRNIPDLTVVTLGMVKEELRQTILLILNMNLDCLNGKTIFIVLLNAWQTVKGYQDTYHVDIHNLIRWGDAYQDIKPSSFILELSSLNSDAYGSIPLAGFVMSLICAIFHIPGC